MTSGKRFSAPHVVALMDYARRRMYALLQAEVPDVYPDLRSAHFRLLSMIPDEGARVTDLAATAGMTKQALGQFVDYLQSHGYAESVRSERDGRVRLVRRTAQGDAARASALGAIEHVEEVWRAELGEERFTQLCDALREVGQEEATV